MVAPGILQVVAGCLGPLLISPRLLRPLLSFWGEKKFLVKTPLLSLVMEPSSWRGAAERTSENFQGVQVKVLVRRFWSQCLGRNVPALNLWLHCLLSIETGDKMDMLAHLFAGILFVPSNGAALECDFCGT